MTGNARKVWLVTLGLAVWAAQVGPTSGAPLMRKSSADFVNVYEASSEDYMGDDTTDTSGVYRVGGLAPGDYTLRFRDLNETYLTEYYDDKPSQNSADPVSVSAGMTSTANAQLALGQTVRQA